MFLEYDELLAEFTTMEMELNRCKKRTARGMPSFGLTKYLSQITQQFSGYALKDVAVFYIMKTNPQIFTKLGRFWNDDGDSYCHVISK